MTSKQVDLTKNFFALGIMFWLYERCMDPTLRWIETSSAPSPSSPRRTPRAQGRLRLRRDDRDLPHALPRARRPSCRRARTATSPATRRRRSASWPRRSSPSATLFYGSTRSRRPATSCTSSRPTRTSASRRSRPRTRSRPSARPSARRYGGALGMTASSGPGIALKSEAMGLAVMVELPLVVVDVQRAGPSTGMPTKTEQADLLQVMFGRNGDSPCRSSRRPRRPSASTTPSRRGASRSST